MIKSLIWVHPVCFYTLFVSNVRQLFAADDLTRRHFSDAFFLGAIRVNFVSADNVKTALINPLCFLSQPLFL